MAEATIIPWVPIFIVLGLTCGILGIVGWMFNTWFRIRHGYPLENSWGKPIYPQRNGESEERVRLLTQENAQVRAELGAVRDRLATVERIVTDRSFRLDQEIEQLRAPVNQTSEG